MSNPLVNLLFDEQDRLLRCAELLDYAREEFRQIMMLEDLTAQAIAKEAFEHIEACSAEIFK